MLKLFEALEKPWRAWMPDCLYDVTAIDVNAWTDGSMVLGWELAAGVNSLLARR